MRPVLPVATRRRRKPARASSKRPKTSSSDAVAERTQPVARVERRPLPEHAVELEVGEDRLAARAGAGRGAPRARTRRPRTPRRRGCSSTSASRPASASRVGVSPKAKFSSVGTSSGQASSSQMLALAVAAGAADLLRVRLEALRQVVVVDVADVGLVDPHPERDRRDDDRRPASPPTTPAPRRAPRRSCRRGTAGPAGRRRPAARATPQRRPLQRHVDDRRPGRPLAQPLDQQPVALGRPRPASSAASGSAGRSR